VPNRRNQVTKRERQTAHPKPFVPVHKTPAARSHANVLFFSAGGGETVALVVVTTTGRPDASILKAGMAVDELDRLEMNSGSAFVASASAANSASMDSRRDKSEFAFSGSAESEYDRSTLKNRDRWGLSICEPAGTFGVM
jgi:hypothetical protein